MSARALLGRFHASYSKSMERRPMLTLCCANATLACLSDLLAQALPHMRSSHPKSEDLPSNFPSNERNVRDPDQTAMPEAAGYDWKRTVRLSAYGAGIAPVVQTWFLTLERWFPLPVGGSSSKVAAAVVRRVAADQIMFSPVGLAAFFSVMATLEGVDVKQRFRDAYVPALIANYKVWPLVQLVNFRFCPPAYRVPFVGSVGVLWTAYLSCLNASAGQKEATDKSADID